MPIDAMATLHTDVIAESWCEPQSDAKPQMPAIAALEEARVAERLVGSHHGASATYFRNARTVSSPIESTAATME
jgi:hypothetical protein